MLHCVNDLAKSRKEQEKNEEEGEMVKPTLVLDMIEYSIYTALHSFTQLYTALTNPNDPLINTY